MSELARAPHSDLPEQVERKSDDRRAEDAFSPAAGLDSRTLLRIQRAAGNRAAGQWLARSGRLLQRQEVATGGIAGKLDVGATSVADGPLAVSFANTGQVLTGPAQVASGRATLNGVELAGGVPMVAVTGGTLGTVGAAGGTAGAGAGAAAGAGGAGTAGTVTTVGDVASKSQPAIRLAWQYQMRLLAARSGAVAEGVAARVVVFTVVRAGVALFFVVGPPLAIYQIATHEGDWETPWAAYAKEVEKRLGPLGGTLPPGGAPPQQAAPPRDPAQAPGTPVPAPAGEPSIPAPAKSPGGQPTPPAHAPGADDRSVEAPGLVDDPAECARRNQQGISHDHHIFPQTLRNEFARIGIEIDDYTITIPAKKHIGAHGVHTVLQWNDHWHTFFDDVPTGPLTPAQISSWRKKALDMAIDLLHIAKMDNLIIHPYRGKLQP